MKYIKIQENDNGSHDNQFTFDELDLGSEWAVIPDEITIPESFPFVDIEVENGIVVEITEKEVPASPTVISTEEIVLSLLLEQEERLCLLELGVQ